MKHLNRSQYICQLILEFQDKTDIKVPNNVNTDYSVKLQFPTSPPRSTLHNPGSETTGNNYASTEYLGLGQSMKSLLGMGNDWKNQSKGPTQDVIATPSKAFTQGIENKFPAPRTDPDDQETDFKKEVDKPVSAAAKGPDRVMSYDHLPQPIKDLADSTLHPIPPGSGLVNPRTY